MLRGVKTEQSPSESRPDDLDPLDAWKAGLTGIPWSTPASASFGSMGWMHNRVRMVAASFLIKNLGIHWRVGEEWFWETLVDADPASNPGQLAVGRRIRCGRGAVLPDLQPRDAGEAL